MNVHKFKKIAWLSLIFIYLVILAGSIVRMSGSGMGCPDWPKCFGSWIPPTNSEDLPLNYQEDLASKRGKKIDKLSDYLAAFGLNESAESLRNDQSLRQKEEPFNATKTWIEYVNRLFGFIAGNLLLIQAIMSIWLFWKKKRSVVWWSVFNLLLIGFQAWFGSIVVATNLLPGIITIHMFLALAVVAIQLLILHKINEQNVGISIDLKLKLVLFLAFGLTLYQIYAGTQLRQEIDHLLEDGTARNELLDKYSWRFYFHRSFAWIILAINILFIYLARETKAISSINKRIGFILIIEVILGITLGYLDLPKAAQPAHLLLATILFAYQFWLMLKLFNNNHSAALRS